MQDETKKSNIIVQFVESQKRHALLAKAKELRLNTNMSGLVGLVSSIYVNAHSIRQNKQIQTAAGARKQTVARKFVWLSGGKVFSLRNDDSASVNNIAYMNDLSK